MLILIITVIVLSVIALIATLNVLTFPRLGRNSIQLYSRQKNDFEFLSPPFVSILVPVRDEAKVIASTIKALMAQDYPHFEVLLLDDGSVDDTAQLSIIAAAGDARFRFLPGKPLPNGWTGKNWACHQLAEQSQGDLIVFTDADVHWEPGALASLTRQMKQREAMVFTVWPTQIVLSWSERLVVPLINFVVLSYLPEVLVRWIPGPIFAAANGQCLAFYKDAYSKVGGHHAVRGEVVEDVALARGAKRSGLRLVMSLGGELIQARMYENWKQVRLGFAKSLLAGFGGRPTFLLISAAFHWVLFVLPWVWFFSGFLVELPPAWPTWPLALLLLGLATRLLSAATSRTPLLPALLMPISVLLMTIIAGQSLWWHYRYGGPRWKGRQILKMEPPRDSRMIGEEHV